MKGSLFAERSSGNVYEDLGFKDAAWMLVKAELVTAIALIISERRLREGEAAELLGLTEPKLSDPATRPLPPTRP